MLREQLATLQAQRDEYVSLQRQLGALRAAKFPDTFRPKQLPPDHPGHHLPDAQGFACGCAGVDDGFVIWLLMSGRGFGKSLVGSTWLVRQALRLPGSEWAVFAPTFRDTRKVCIEGSTGILAAIGEGELGNYRRNELEIILANGSKIYGYSADQPERARGANLWGAWCVARGELVLTDAGDVPIEDVRPGDWVWTRRGWRRVTATQMTQRDVEVLRVVTSAGTSVRVTGNHRIWTEQHGWVEARALRYGDTLSAWTSSSGHRVGSSGKVCAGTSAAGAPATTQTAPAACCTLQSGNAYTGSPCPTAMLSTTSITTSPTMIRATCSCSPALTTSGSTTLNTPVASPPLRTRNSAALRPGTPGLTGLSGNAPALCAPPCSCPRDSAPCTAPRSARLPRSGQITGNAETPRCLSGSVSGAAPDSSPRTAVPSTAAASAASGPETPPNGPVTVLGSASLGVSTAEPRLSLRTAVSDSAGICAVPGTDVVRVEPAGLADVFDLQVEGAHEFVANGTLVHNCDELGSWRYEATWHEGLVPALRKGEKPRIVVTTTPRPTKLIRDLVGRRDGSVHVTRGSTWENALNLSATALAELKHRYEGSRLGRQELEGELLEDIEGALWSRGVIDQCRVGQGQVPELTRVVVAIDPAVTSGDESDESGIVVVGHCGDHGYVLGDYSFRGTPNEVMRRAIWVYRNHKADCIVAEVNNGGDYIGNTLRTLDPQIPYKTVHASRGKVIRAEPVSSLYEMGRMHHVGTLPELEDQLCSFVPGIGVSPDRMDALVWAVTELRGLTEGSWLAAYGAYTCPGCGHAFLPEYHKACPKCGATPDQ